MSITKDYLKSVIKLLGGGGQAKYLQFLLDEGTVFTEREDTDIEGATIKKKGCYKNAMMYSIKNEVEYWEGFYCVEPVPELPLEHAFNVENGKLIDITGQKFSFSIKEWYGIKIPFEVISEYVSSDCPDWVMPLNYYYEEYYNKTVENEKI